MRSETLDATLKCKFFSRIIGIRIPTCKDRWRQVLNEANRIGKKHLLTVQQGISLNQFREMRVHDVQLVVPAEIIKLYHKDIRAEIMTVEGFLSEVKTLDS